MSHWPNVDRVADRTMVEALRGGDRTIPPRICDAYCARLYDFAHSIVHDDAAAAAVVQDTMIAAKSHIGALVHPGQLRSWLYSIARAEALYRRGTPGVGSAPGTPRPPSVTPMEASSDEDDVAQVRLMVRDALAGLRLREHELLRLYGPHELGTYELAVTLGRPERQVPPLLRTARANFTDTVTALIVARTGRAECGALSRLIDDWDGPLTPALRRRLIRHIDGCTVCRERRRRRVATDALLSVMPIAEPPQDLEERAMAAMFDPEGVPYRAEVTGRVGTLLRRDGNPRQPDLSGRPPWRTLTAAAVVALLVGALLGVQYGGTPVSADGVPPQPADILASGNPALRGPDGKIIPSIMGLPGATPTPGVTPTPGATPGATPGVTPSGRPSDGTTPEAPGPSEPEPPVTGTLSASPGSRSLAAGETTATVTLSASGAPVAWSATGSATASPGSGTTSPGSPSSVTVSVTRGTGAGSASVTFASSGGSPTVTLTWEAETAPNPDPPAGDGTGDGTTGGQAAETTSQRQDDSGPCLLNLLCL